MASSVRIDRLLEENRMLKVKLRLAEEEVERMRVTMGKAQAPLSPRSPSLFSGEGSMSPSGKRGFESLGSMVAQVVDVGKKRRLGDAVDPESGRGNSIPVMVKIGGVVWEDGIGGVSAAPIEAGVLECDGTRWLVPEGELARRKERGSLLSTVVARVRGVEVAGQLFHSGLWVGGRWCSVRKFVAVPPKPKEPGWRKVMGRLKEIRREDYTVLVKDVQEAGMGEVGKVMKEVRGEVQKLANVAKPGSGASVGMSGGGVTAKELGVVIGKLEERLKAGLGFLAKGLRAVE